MADVPVTYVGIHGEVDVPALHELQGVKSVVEYGETVSVPPDVAGKAPKDDDPGSGLLAQPDNWLHPNAERAREAKKLRDARLAAVEKAAKVDEKPDDKEQS